MTSMYEFKINNEVKENLGRELKKSFKEAFKNNDYIEFAIMYNTDKERFFITETFNIAELEYKGNVYYKTVTANKEDKITIKNLIAEIF